MPLQNKTFIFYVCSSQSYSWAGNEAALTLIQYSSKAQETRETTYSECKWEWTKIFSIVIQSCKLDSAPEFNQRIHGSVSTYTLQFLHEIIPCKSIQNIMQEKKYPSCKLFERGDEKWVSKFLSGIFKRCTTYDKHSLSQHLVLLEPASPGV